MRLSDVEPAAEVHVQVWREAYVGLLPADYLAGLDPRHLAQRRQAHLVDPGMTRNVVGLDPTGRIVAVAAAGPGRDDDPPTPWELWSINVLASQRGTGLADLLMTELVADCATYLWVLEGNRRATAFYGRYGFGADGATKPHPPTRAVEVRMRRATENKPAPGAEHPPELRGRTALVQRGNTTTRGHRAEDVSHLGATFDG